MRQLFSISILLLVLTACNNTAEEDGPIEITGTIEATGITSYQYGSHIISNGDVFHALTSDEIDLTEYEGRKVTVIGEKIEGYSLDGGPEYLRVKEIRD